MRLLTLDLETIQPGWVKPPEAKRDFPSLPWHRIICACWIKVTVTPLAEPVFEVGYLSKEIIEPVFNAEGKVVLDHEKGFSFSDLTALGDKVRDCDRMITWNGRGFDLPLIRLETARCGLDMRWCDHERLRRFPDFKKGDLWHWDLMDQMTNNGASDWISLNDAAIAFGLPGKGQTTGKSITELYSVGRSNEIRNYCLEDVLHTWLIACKWQHMAEGSRDLTDATLGWASTVPEFKGWFERKRLIEAGAAV